MQRGKDGAIGAGRSAVVRLALTDFRCHRQLRVETAGETVALVGGNGVGKTSVLEALSLLAPGRGLRRARLADIGRRQDVLSPPAPWAVAARLAGAEGVTDIGTGIDGGGERRIVRIDGEPQRSQSALAGVVAVLWLTPEMDRLFTDGAAARRRFLDRIVYGLEPAHAARVSAYERAMRERARLLAEGGADPAWLAALEWQMAREGIAIAASRREVAERLGEAAWQARDAQFPRASIAVTGTVDGWLAAGDADAALARFARGLGRGRASDAASGTTALGPHRSDVEVRHVASGRLAADCSTGEQKALLIAIVLAAAALCAAARSGPPILLLDEVAAHLDERRRRQLFAAVHGLGGQAWYAGTDAATFAPLASTIQILPLDAAGPAAGGYAAAASEGAVVHG